MIAACTLCCHTSRDLSLPSIAGHRLEYETGLGHVYKEGENSDKIKSDFTGSNDLLQLCRFLMRAHGIHQQLWFAQVIMTSSRT